MAVKLVDQCTDEGVSIYDVSPVDRDSGLVGNLVWPSGLALAKFFAWREAHPAERGTCVGKAVLELGAGTGVVGLTLGRLGATVTLTDGYDIVLKALQRNIAANCLDESAAVHRLYFGNPSTYLGGRTYDVIVAADVLYDVNGYGSAASPLAHAIAAHVSVGAPREVFLAYEHRTFILAGFFSEMHRMGFRIERLEDGDGKAVAVAMGQPLDSYDGSRFAMLCADCWLSLEDGDTEFSPNNQQKTQIFRLLRPLETSLCTDEGIIIHEASLGNEDDLCGNVLCASGLALAKFFSWRQSNPREKDTCVGKAVLELGAGTGVVGLTLGRLGSRVTLTDGEVEVMRLLQRNIQANSLEEKASSHRLRFGETDHYLAEHTYDLIVAADILYDVRNCCQGSILAQTLDAHVIPGSSTEVFLAYRHRRMEPVWHEGHLTYQAWYREFFADMLRLGFHLERLEDEDGRAVGGAMGQSTSTYDLSFFVALSLNDAPDAIADATYSPGNAKRVQILRLSRPKPLA